MAADGDSTGEVSESESDDEAYEVELAVKGAAAAAGDSGERVKWVM